MSKARVIKINPKSIDQGAINEAARLLENGGLVVFPTDTVYGLAANLLNKGAIERLKKIKDRPQDKQFSIHISNKVEVEKYAVEVLPRAYKVIDHFWPGPLTVVLSAPDGKSVGLRMPKNDVALRLFGAVDFPVVAPSANFSGQPAPTDAESLPEDFADQVELILDAGPTEFGMESTVLDARTLPFSVLREGALKTEVVLSVANKKTVLFVCTGNSCRSVMAEYLLKKQLMDSGRQDVDVISAGTFAFLGMGPTRETQKLVGDIGLDASDHRAQRLSYDLLKKSDLVLVMEKRHQEEILRQSPQLRDRVHVLGEFVKFQPEDQDVPDPIGKSEDFYKSSFLKIQEAVQRLRELI